MENGKCTLDKNKALKIKQKERTFYRIIYLSIILSKRVLSFIQQTNELFTKFNIRAERITFASVKIVVSQ